MKFTAIEIKLCQDIAKKWRKEIKYGDWYLNYQNQIYLQSVLFAPQDKEDIPLLTLEDCLEFLRGRKWRIVQFYEGYGTIRKDKSPDVVSIKLWNWENDLLPEVKGSGKTPLEACLKAVLAVLEEEG